MPPGKVQNDPVGKSWSERRGSNPRPPAPKAGALPLRYAPMSLPCPATPRPALPRPAGPCRERTQEPPARCRRPPAGGPQKACRKFGGRDPDGHGPGHDDSLCSFPSSPSQPQSRQRPEVGRGRCRSRGRKEKPGLRLPQCRAS